MASPPPYSPTNDQHYPSTNDQHYYPHMNHRASYHQSYTQPPGGTGYHQSNYQVQSPCSDVFSPTTSASVQSPQSERGLGGLIVGLGAAAMLNNAMNQPQGQQAATTLLSPNSRAEDPLSVLARYDTVLLIDDSASMSEGNRWREAGLAVSGLADAITRYDVDGIDVYFMNSIEYLRNARSAGEVNQLFERVRPVGRSTPTDLRVEELLSSYLNSLETTKLNRLPPLKPLNLIVITDGEADDPDTLAYALVGFAERLDEGRYPLSQLGVQFIQIGNDKAATKALKNLDDELKSAGSARRDIVDTTPYKGKLTTEFLVKALLGGINKRIDRSS